MTLRRTQARASFQIETMQGARSVTQPASASTRPLSFLPTQDPVELSRQILALQTNMNATAKIVATAPLAITAVILGLAVTSGTAFPLRHGLGKVPTGWFCCDALGAAWSGYRVPPATGARGPSGGPQELDYLTLQPTATGTFSFVVF